VFAVLRLLPGSDWDKDAEILPLRHQLAVVHRQFGGQKICVPARRPGTAGRTAPTPAAAPAAGPDAAGRSGHDPALAPRPDRPPPRHGIPPTPAWPTTHGPLGPGPGVTPGPGEPLAGLPAHPRRTPRPRREDCSVDGLGDPPRGGHRPRPRAVHHHVGGLPALPGRSPVGGRLHRDGDLDRDPDVPPRGHRARHSPGAGPRRDRAPHRGPGSPRPPATWSWTRKTPTANCEVPDPGLRTPSTRRCSTPSSPTPASRSCSAGSGYPG